MEVNSWQRTEGTLHRELRMNDGILKIDERVYKLQKTDNER